MIANNSKKRAQIDNRRRIVAGLRLRHLTMREIVVQLAKQDIINENTGKPYCLAVINRDLKAIHKQWQEDAAQDTSALIAMTKAELEEVRRKAWQHGELVIVLKSLQQECKLLGLDAPTKIAPTDPSGTKEYDNITDDDRIARLAAILDAARERRDGEAGGGDDTGGELAS